MKSKKLQMIAFCLVALATLFVSSSAKADTWNKATKLTFPEAVEVAGTVLEPGTYWFQLMDSPANRNIVQVWNADRSQLITTILTIPNYRLRPNRRHGREVLRKANRHSGSYPGVVLSRR